MALRVAHRALLAAPAISAAVLSVAGAAVDGSTAALAAGLVDVWIGGARALLGGDEELLHREEAIVGVAVLVEAPRHRGVRGEAEDDHVRERGDRDVREGA